jgi:hypothetical protein
MSFGEILDQGFKVLKDHFVLLTSLMATVYVPYSVLGALVKPSVAERGVPSLLNTTGIFMGSLGVLMLVCALPYAQLAVTRAVSDAYLSKPTTFLDAYRAAGPMYTPYLGTCFLMGVCLIGLAILLLVPMVYFAVCWLLVGPIAVVEGTFGRAAMKRSRALTDGYWWRTLGAIFVSSLLGGIVEAGVQLVLGSIPILGPMLTGLVQSIVSTYSSIVMVVVYVDLRCRKEDFDLELLAARVAAGTTGAVTPAVTAGQL